MRFQKLVLGFLLATTVALAAVASTALGNQDKTQQAQASKEKEKPEPPKGNLDRLEVEKLNEILATNRQLLNRLDTLQGTTLPHELNSVQKVVLDGILASQTAILQAIDGFQAQCTSADLVPTPALGIPLPYGFCQYNADNTKLRIHIVNQGGVQADASMTRVTFFNVPTPVDQATPALAPFGGFVDLLYDIPPACFGTVAGDSNCPFTINADVGTVVNESNEGNNTAQGVCIRVG